MENLEKYRNEVNEIDKKIVDLLEKRFDIVIDIGNYKRKYNMPVHDMGREQAVFNNIYESLKNKDYKDSIDKIFSIIINVSKMLQY